MLRALGCVKVSERPPPGVQISRGHGLALLPSPQAQPALRFCCFESPTWYHHHQYENLHMSRGG